MAGNTKGLRPPATSRVTHSVTLSTMPARQAYNFCFTVYSKKIFDEETQEWISGPKDIPPEEIEEIKSIELGTKSLKYILFQHERCPTTGRQHLQGFLQVKNKQTIKSIQELLNRKDTHIEICAGSAGQNVEYCTKLLSKDGEAFQKGTPPKGKGQRSDLADALLEVKKGKSIWVVSDSHPQPIAKYWQFFKQASIRYSPKRNWRPKVTVYWGSSWAGKSTRVRNEESMADIHTVTSQNPKWFDGYDRHEVLLLDDFHGGWYPITVLLNLLGQFEFLAETKGGHVQLLARRIYITSNYHPREWYPNAKAPSLRALKNRIAVIEKMEEGNWAPPPDCDPQWIIADPAEGTTEHVCDCPGQHHSWCRNHWSAPLS